MPAQVPHLGVWVPVLGFWERDQGQPGLLQVRAHTGPLQVGQEIRPDRDRQGPGRRSATDSPGPQRPQGDAPDDRGQAGDARPVASELLLPATRSLRLGTDQPAPDPALAGIPEPLARSRKVHPEAVVQPQPAPEGREPEQPSQTTGTEAIPPVADQVQESHQHGIFTDRDPSPHQDRQQVAGGTSGDPDPQGTAFSQRIHERAHRCPGPPERQCLPRRSTGTKLVRRRPHQGCRYRLPQRLAKVCATGVE